MIHTLKCIISSMAIGYIVYTLLYYHNNKCIVKFKGGILSTIDLMIILAVVGLFLSLL